jgi:hypothetical protein
MTELKTKANDASVEAFLNAIDNDTRREDAFAVLKMMQSVTRLPPCMWGPSIVGFGRYHYKYASGHEGDMCLIGFSPRAQALTIYIMPGFQRVAPLMKKLGRHKTGKGCLYIRSLRDVDTAVLKTLVTDAYRYMKMTHAS